MLKAKLWHDFVAFVAGPQPASSHGGAPSGQDRMRLPGTRYQEHGWEHVRKLLGLCSLRVFQQCDMEQLLAQAPGASLDWYTDAMAQALLDGGSARADSAGNSYGESALELALSLAYELQSAPSYWDGLLAAIGAEQARGAPVPFWQRSGADAMLRKKVNDMYAGLRDKVDADACQATLGVPCSPNKMYTYRMLDTAYHDIAALFADWQQHAPQVAAILGRALDGVPIEVRQMKTIAGCHAAWLIRWSATLEQFGAGPGPLHTRSKRFASLKNSPEKIAAMLADIGDYEELSANLDRADDWHGDAGEAALWLEDYWRVLAEGEAAGTAGPDQLLEASVDEFAADGDADDGEPDSGPDVSAEPALQSAHNEAVAAGLSLPPRYIELATAAQDGNSRLLLLLKDDTLAVRLAVYQKMLGGADQHYPDAWRDPATGALPTLQQLAVLDGVSVPTLRKRRNEAIDRLQDAVVQGHRRIV